MKNRWASLVSLADWILSQFGGLLGQTQNSYRQFVLDGIDEKIEPWSELKNQIYLGG